MLTPICFVKDHSLFPSFSFDILNLIYSQAEKNELPWSLECGSSATHLLIGSVTIDSKPAVTKVQELAQRECDASFQTVFKGSSKEKKICLVSLDPPPLKLNGDEQFRIVYQCYQDVPDNWDMKETKTGNNDNDI